MLKSEEVRRQVAQRLRELLPKAKGWQETVGAKIGSQAADLMARFQLAGQEHTVVVEVTSLGQPRQIRAAVTKLNEIRRDLPGAYPVAGAVYIGPQSARILKSNNLGFVDLSGNCYLALENALIEKEGKRNVRPSTRPLRSLFAPRATRVIRVLLVEPGRAWRLEELGRAPELLESPGPTGLDEQHADDPRRARGEERPERPGGGTDVPLAFLLDQGVLEREVTVARQVHESEVVALEDARALRTDVDRAGYRVGARKVPADLVQLRHGSTDLPRLAQRCDLDDDRVLLAGQLESSHQIGCLRSDLGSDGFLPALCLREELPKSLGHLPPNLLGFQHLSLAPGISASAETIRRNESACQEKTYVSTLEQ